MPELAPMLFVIQILVRLCPSRLQVKAHLLPTAPQLPLAEKGSDAVMAKAMLPMQDAYLRQDLSVLYAVHLLG